jgi:hypothetical protein
MKEWKKVSVRELRTFIQTYPTFLEYDCTGICEPPMRSWNDFTGGKVWPESMVAKQFMYDDFGWILTDDDQIVQLPTINEDPLIELK